MLTAPSIWLCAHLANSRSSTRKFFSKAIFPVPLQTWQSWSLRVFVPLIFVLPCPPHALQRPSRHHAKHDLAISCAANRLTLTFNERAFFQIISSRIATISPLSRLSPAKSRDSATDNGTSLLAMA